MKKVMPQELEVWYLIPALRREIAKILIKDYGLRQKRVAECLGITEAAISQYLRSKRGKEIKFSEKAREEIKKAAEEIAKGKSEIIEKVYDLCVSMKKSKAMCEFHRKWDKKIPKNCNICIKD
ncbi:MAG TPA: transcriptional regulator [Candidatus Omnitrophota bacterium]|nr:transcriptional regulator [Candidatus Omnitrophota bacterium]